MALKPEASLDPSQCGDLLFSSTAPTFRTDMLLSRQVTSRTYSFYYPQTRPDIDRCAIVASTNANYADWAGLSKTDYETGKRDLIEDTLRALEKYVPDIRSRLDYAEAATPLTFERYTKHLGGSSFGTKFEGLAVSRALPEQIAGLYHAGSVGIIMSGWLGAVNYGVIVANDVDAFLMKQS
jgi:phytoene dehydrogenase-like protein